jgi:hypothetical protein
MARGTHSGWQCVVSAHNVRCFRPDVHHNNAEHAIKALARLRRAIEGLSTPRGIEEYLILLSICQTCKYSGLDFLEFLRSGEADIGVFRRDPTERSPV